MATVKSISLKELFEIYSGEYNLDDNIIYDFEGLEIARGKEILQVPLPFYKANGEVKVRSFSSMEIEELMKYHDICHTINSETLSPQFCKLHFLIANELLNRGCIHSGESYCDRVVELIRGDFDDYIKNISSLKDEVLSDDYRIVCAWYSRIKQNKKLYKTLKDGTKKEITQDDLVKLGKSIVSEMRKRGFNFNVDEYKGSTKEFWDLISENSNTLKHIVNVQDITSDLIKSLNDSELDELWKWLHAKWASEFPDRSTPEDYLSANIIIQMERYKRHLIDANYEDKDELDAKSRMAWQEYAAPRVLSKITLEQVLELFRENGNVSLKGDPYFVYLCGSLVNRGFVEDDSDIDVLVMGEPDPKIISAFSNLKPEWLSKKIHLIFDKEGKGIGNVVPLYSLSMNIIPRADMVKTFSEDIEIGKYIVGVKPRSGFGKYEFWDANECWKNWGVNHRSSIVEEKVDGRRFQIHIDKAHNKLMMYSEDTQQDRADLFPEISKELMSLDLDNAIFDGEILGYEVPPNLNIKSASLKRKFGTFIPREDTAYITSAKEIDPNQRKNLVLVIYDIICLNGKSLADKGYKERRELYSSLIKKSLKYIDVVEGVEVHTVAEFLDAIEKMRRLNGSEGVVIKDANMVYPIKYSGENRSSQMCKLKNLKEIDVIVLGITQKKSSEDGKPLDNFMYECGVEMPESEVQKYSEKFVKHYNKKPYLVIGTTYSTSCKCNIGDIISVRSIRIRDYYDDNGKKYYTWMFPLFVGKSSKKSPDTITTVEKIAKVKTSPLSEEAIVRVELQPCKYWNQDVCELRRKFKSARDSLSKDITIEKEVLKYPVKCPLAQLFKCRYLKPYYYEIRKDDLQQICDQDSYVNLLSLPKRCRNLLLSKYMECPKGEHEFVMESHILTSDFVPNSKKIPKVGSQHLDFRFKVDGYLEGWSIVGGSVDDQITPNKLLTNSGFRAEEKAQQDVGWLFKEKGIIKKDVDSLKPNDEVPEMFDVIVGDGMQRGKMFVITRGSLIFGAQKPMMHEYFIKDGKFFKDWTRVVVRAIGVESDDKKTKEIMWKFMIPKDQTPYAISDRAIGKRWKPDKSNLTPFPVEWTIKNFKEQYEKWKHWLNELSKCKIILLEHIYRGAIHVRALFQKSYFLFIDTGEPKIKAFKLSGNPALEDVFGVYLGEVDRKYSAMRGVTKPNTFFNRTKELEGRIIELLNEDSDVDFSVSDGLEHIRFNIGKGDFKGVWELIQEDKHSDMYFVNISGKSALAKYELSKSGMHCNLDIFYNGIIRISIPSDFRLMDSNSNVICSARSNPLVKSKGEKLSTGISKLLLSGNCLIIELLNPEHAVLKLTNLGNWMLTKVL